MPGCWMPVPDAECREYLRPISYALSRNPFEKLEINVSCPLVMCTQKEMSQTTEFCSTSVQVGKIYGVGPKSVTEKMINNYFK